MNGEDHLSRVREEGRRVLGVLRRHLPAGDALHTAPPDEGGDIIYRPEDRMVLFRHGGRLLTADDEGRAVVNFPDLDGASVSVFYRDGLEVDRHRTGPSEQN